MEKFAILLLFLIFLSTLSTINCRKEKNETGGGAVRRKMYRPKSPDLIEEEEEQHYEEYQHRTRLVEQLLGLYNTIVPGANVVTVDLGISLDFIIQLDYLNQILVTNMKLHMKWADNRLKWNSSDFGGIKRLAVPPHRVWKPAILLHNSGDEGFDASIPVDLTVNNDGIIHYNPPGVFKSFCEVETKDFPFDYQTCKMKFGPMHDEGFQTQLLPYIFQPPFDASTSRSHSSKSKHYMLNNYVRNSLWDIVNISMSQNSKNYIGVDVPLEDLTFAILLRAKPTYYIWTLICPILFVSYTLPLLLLIPINSKERLISIVIFFEMVPPMLRYSISYLIPNTSNGITFLGQFVLLVSTLGAIALVESIFQLYSFKSKQHTSYTIENRKLLINHTNSNGSQMTDVDAKLHEWEITRTSRRVDFMLMLVFYLALTAAIFYMFCSLPWMHDGRQHL